MNKAVLPAVVAVGFIGACIGGVAYGDAPRSKSQDRFPMMADAGFSGIQRYAEADAATRKAPVPAASSLEDKDACAPGTSQPRCALPPPPMRPFMPLQFAGPGFGPPPFPPPEMAGLLPPPPFSPPADKHPSGLAAESEPLLASITLALALSAQETALGIQRDQLDTWRAYSDAIQDLAEPPLPLAASKPEPFGITGALATRAVEEGRKAQVLLDAREALKAKLTPAQLEKAARLDRSLQDANPGAGQAPDSKGRTEDRP